jgi:hypothetical protein
MQRLAVVCKDGAARVVPPAIVANVNEEIRFIAINSAVTVWMPETSLFGVQQFEVKPGAPQTQTVKGVPGGEYPYAVFCHVMRRFAEGNSSPIIIVE